MRRVARLLLVLATSTALTAGVVACTDDDSGAATQDPNRRLVEVYATAIEAVVSEAGALPGEDDDRLNLYLEVREDAEVSAEVQVGVLTELEGWAEVRFIDSLEEAVDLDADGAPVRGDGVLIGLGSVSEGATAAVVMLDRYEGPASTTVFEIDVVRRAGEWSVDGSPRTVSVDAP